MLVVFLSWAGAAVAQTADPDQAPMQTSGAVSTPSAAPAANVPAGGAAAKPASPITPPKLTHSVVPVYPTGARNRGIGGTVLVDLYVNDHGLPQQVRFKQGPKEFDKAAVDAVKQYKFKPAMQDGKPVGTDFTVTLNFIATKQPTGLLNTHVTHGM